MAQQTTKERLQDTVAGMSETERERLERLYDGEIYVRASAVSQQARRIRARDQPGAEYQGDMWLFAEAVRSVLRAAEACTVVRDGQRRAALEAAIARFVEANPQVAAVRDALEHFDEYLVGLGRRQARGHSYQQVFERGQHLRVRIGPWTLDVDKAESEALHLASIALAGVDAFDQQARGSDDL